MAEFPTECESKEATGLSIEMLKKKIEVTDEQINARVEDSDLPELSLCFDNTEDYVEKLKLSPGEQTDVRVQAFVNGTHTGMKLALKLWKNKNPLEATFRALLLILLSLLKGDVAVQVCKYLAHRCCSSITQVNRHGSTPAESERLPILTLPRHFTNLGVGKLSENDFEKIGIKLFLESSELDCKFNTVCSELYFSLKQRTDSKEDLVACLMSLNAFEPVFKSANQPVFKDQKAKLFGAKRLYDVWRIISPYHSFFNYYLVEHIIECLGTEKDKKNMTSYKQSFAEYAKRRVYECPAEFGYENQDDCTIIVKLDRSYDDCAVEQLEKLRIKFCEILQLNPQVVLRLLKVEKGCYELTFQAPAFIQEAVFPLSSEQEDALKKLKVVWLLCGDYEFTPPLDDIVDDQDQSEDDDEDDQYSDGASQVSSLLQAAVPTFKTSPGSTSDSGIGKSVLNTETKSILSEFAQENQFTENELLPQDEQPALPSLMPSMLTVAAFNGDLLKVKYCSEVLHSNPLILDYHGNTALHTAVFGEQLKILEYLIEEQKVSPLTLSSNGSSALHIAALNGCLPLVKYFVKQIENDPLLQNSQQKNPLHFACQNGNTEVFSYLLMEAEQHDSLNTILNDRTNLGSTMLHFAASSGNCRLMELLIDKYGLDLNTPGELGATALLVAAQEGHLNIVQFLVSQKNCCRNITLDNVGQNILHIAACKGHFALVKYLRSWKSLNSNAKDSAGCTPLHLASQAGHIDIVKYLVEEYGSYPLCLTKSRLTPLHLAASSGQIEVVKFLIGEKNLDPYSRNTHISPLEVAAHAGKFNIVEYYLNILNCKVNHPFRIGERLLFEAVHHGHLSVVKQLIKKQEWTQTNKGFRQNLLLVEATTRGRLEILKYLILNCKWEYLQELSSQSLVTHAAAYGHLKVLKFLAEHDFNQRNNMDITPLHAACSEGHLHIVEYLINDCSLKTSVVGKEGFSAIHVAAISGHVNIVQYLVENQIIDLFHISKHNKMIPLHSAVSAGKLEVVKYFILESQISPNFPMKRGLCPLHIACINGNKDIVQFLLEQLECDPHKLDSSEFTPLDYAVRYGCFDIVVLMAKVEKCSELFKDDQAQKILHIAAAFGRLEIIKYLIINLSIDPNTPRFCDKVPFLPAGPYLPGFTLRTPLQAACSAGQVNVVRYLIFDRKCSFAPNKNGTTMLHIAAGNGQVGMMKFLINKLYMDPLIRTNNGSTPLHYAVLLEECESAKYLVNTRNCDPNVLDDDGLPPIHHAATNRLNLIRDGLSTGDMTAFEYFVNELKCNPTIPSNDGLNALHCAAEVGDLKVTVFLVSVFKRFNYDVFTPDVDGQTPLHSACRSGKCKIVDYLSPKSGEGVTALRDKFQQSPLHYAALGGDLETVKLLVVKKHHDPYCTDNRGYTPLHTATVFGHTAIVKWFINNLSLDPNCRTGFNTLFTVFHIACKQGMEAVVKYLISLKKCDKTCVDAMNYTGLHYAIMNGHCNIVKMLCMGRHCDILHQDLSGSTPLERAVAQNQFDCVKILVMALKKQTQHFHNHCVKSFSLACSGGNLKIVAYLYKEIGSHISNCNEIVRTAISNNQLEVVDFLLTKWPQSLDSKNWLGENLLHTAAETGNINTVKLLLAKFSMNPNSPNVLGLTPLHTACFHGNHTVIKHLASWCTRFFDVEGRTPLHHAAIGGHLHIIKELLTIKDYRKFRFHKDNKGYTPCHLALRQGYMYIVDFFIDQLKQNSSVLLHREKDGSLLSNVPIYRGTICTAQLAVHRAAFNGFIEAVKFLIERESHNPNYRDRLGRTALHYAAMSNKTEIVEYLIEKAKCVIAAEDVFHNLPLHYAAAKGSIGSAVFLIANGSPHTSEGMLHMTPHDMAVAGGHSMLQVVLKVTPASGVNVKKFLKAWNL